MLAPTRLLLAAALVSSGCSKIADPKKLDPHIPADVAAFCGQAVDLLIQRAAACLATTEDFERLNQVYLPCEAWDYELGLGHLSYDRFSAADCIAGVGAKDCALLFSPNGELPSECGQAVSGSLNNGDPCTVDAACASGHCEVGTTCPGSCAPFLGRGETGCSPLRKVGKQCSPGFFCSAGTCLDIIFTNQNCSGHPNGCEPGSTCDPASSLCAPLKTPGAVCAGQSECLPGLLCAPNPIATRCVVPLAPGQACTVGQRNCLIGAYCKSAAMNLGDAGTCTDYAGVGGGCDLGAAEPRGCLGGWCDTSTPPGTCSAFIAETVGCTLDPQCGPGGICTPGVNVCFKACYP
jgi:hypothetical protein